MTENDHSQITLDFRPAEPSDADLAGQLLFDTFPEIATHIIGLGDESRGREVLENIFPVEGHRLSYEHAIVALDDDQPVGMSIAFPASELLELDIQLGKVVLREYDFGEKLSVIFRSLPVIFIREAVGDEYLLSNIAVRESYRGKGIGSRILSHIEEKAEKNEFHRIALLVSIENEAAQRFYEDHGYEVKAVHLESEDGGSQLGHGYKRMVKNLRE